MERGIESMEGSYVNGLKGKVAEFDTKDLLKANWMDGDVEIALDPTQPVWDISAIDPQRGRHVLIQVKSVRGGFRQLRYQDLIEANSNIHYY